VQPQIEIRPLATDSSTAGRHAPPPDPVNTENVLSAVSMVDTRAVVLVPEMRKA
jgi:hypothetical protein